MVRVLAGNVAKNVSHTFFVGSAGFTYVCTKFTNGVGVFEVVQQRNCSCHQPIRPYHEQPIVKYKKNFRAIQNQSTQFLN